MYSHVYIIGWSENGPCKIGKANSPRRRINTLQSAHPYKLKVYFAARVRSSRAHEIEFILHEYFDKDRLSGEWFDISAQTAEDALREHMGQMSVSFTVWSKPIPRNRKREIDALSELRYHYQEIGGR